MIKLKTEKQGIKRLVFDLQNEKVNKLSLKVLLKLDETLDQLSKNKETKLLTIESGKEKIFIAGADISEIQSIQNPKEAEEKSKQGQEILSKIENLPFSTVAVIHGACLGGGLELALCCDYRVVTDAAETKIGLPEVNLGIIPGFGGCYRLPKVIGLEKSLEMITTGKIIDGRKAFKIGLADACYHVEYLEMFLPSFLEKIKNSKKKKKKPSFLMRQFLLEKNIFGRKLLFSMAKSQLLKKTKGFYPAPLKAIQAISKIQGKRRKKALKIERKIFSILATTEISKNLINLFYTSEALKKDTGVNKKNNVSPKKINTLGVLGAGIMGGGIAWLFSYKDFRVLMKDMVLEFLQKGFDSCYKIYKNLYKRRKITSREIELKMLKINGVLDYQGMDKAEVIVEAIVEDLQIKNKVFKELETHISKEAIVASNTSSLSITEMAKAFKAPKRFLGMHFFNPVNRMLLVEIIAGKETSDQAIVTLVFLSKKLGKVPVVVKDCPGFLVNRILFPYLNEALYLLIEGCPIEKIDQAIVSYGMPMGPLTLLDEVGLDTANKVGKILENGYGKRMEASIFLKEMVEEKKLLGKKNKKGFYLYESKNPLVNSEIFKIVKRYRKSKKKNFSSEEIVERCFLAMINESAKCLEEGIISKACYLDMATIMGIGFPPFRGGILRYADAFGIEKISKRLTFFYDTYGKRYEVARLLLEMSAKKKKFY